MDIMMKTDFLRRRMTQLREKNNYTITQMANAIHISKSALSRAEKIGGETSFNKVHEFAEKYCDVLGMTEKQKKLFLRGERAVVVDTSALLTRPDLLGELSEEYSCVFIPGFVIDDLKNIKNNNANVLGGRALDLITKIRRNERIQTKNYSIPSTSEMVIIDIANAVSEELCCDVDIITNDVPRALQIKGSITEKSPYNLLFLEEYAATKQKLVNWIALNAINDYYANSYDDIEDVLGIRINSLSEDEWNCFLADGSTLIISAVDNCSANFEQRREKIRWLIKNGADVNRRDRESKNFPPITHAIKKHDYKMFSFLLNECGANPNIGSRNPYDVGKIRQKNDGNMPLMVAAWEEQEEMVKDLCADKRVSLNQQDGNGFTALIKACIKGNKRCRRIIEEAGADVTILDHEGLSAEDRWDEFIRNSWVRE